MKKMLLIFSILFLSIINLSAHIDKNNNILNSGIDGALAINGNDVFAFYDINVDGFYFSSDLGNTWDNKGLAGSGVTSIVIIDSTIIVGVYQTLNGIYVSHDYGNTWLPKVEGFANSLLIKDSIIFAGFDRGISGGIYQSTDFGNNWTRKDNLLKDSSVYTLAAKGNKLFAGGDNGIYSSTDNGNSWSLSGLYNKPVISIAICGNNICAGVSGEIYLSDDNGLNWSHKSKRLSNNILSFGISGNFIFAGSWYNGVFMSSDFGNSWNYNPIWLPHNCVVALAVSNNYIFAATDGGIFRAKLSDLLTDVKDSSDNNLLNLSPNPATDYLSISFPAELPQGKIEIFSIEGIKIIETEVVNRIDVRALIPGVYFVKFGGRVEKFLKM